MEEKEKFWAGVRRVLQYEIKQNYEKDALRKVLLWMAMVLLAINVKNVLVGHVWIALATAVGAVLMLFFRMCINRSTNLKWLTYVGSSCFILLSFFVLYIGGNHGFSNLWFLLFPFILLILVGLPVGLPICILHGTLISIFMWSPLHQLLRFDYSWDYRFYYPWFYWGSCILLAVVDVFYKYYKMEQENYEKQMEELVQQSVADTKQLMVDSIYSMAQLLEEKDSDTKEHSHRVACYGKELAKYLHPEWSEVQLQQLYQSALLHDIGKIAIPDYILKNHRALEQKEYEIIKTHPLWGKRILEPLKFIPLAQEVAYEHHEFFNGKGYPKGKGEKELSEAVRIISVADAFDAMNSNRRYRKQCDGDYIIQELNRGKGSQFDPVVVEGLLELIKQGKIVVE